MKKRFLFMVTVLAGSLWLGGCEILAAFFDGKEDGSGGKEPPGTSFVAVSEITNVPGNVLVNTNLALTGTVTPHNATNKAIVWSVKSAGTTDAVIDGNSLSAENTGTITVTATIASGQAAETDYTQDFSINIVSTLPGLLITQEEVSYLLKPVPGGTVPLGKTWSYQNIYPLPHTVSTFYMGETEIPYELWYKVRTWAENKGYIFSNPGREGSSGTIGSTPVNGQHPVTRINWRDTVVWCNAYSEMTERTPVYYLEGTTDFSDNTKVLRESEGVAVSPLNGKADKAAVNPQANGFRLPTEAEWEYAARGGNPDAVSWSYDYAGSSTAGTVAVYGRPTTAVVKSMAANSLGLYDMSGNIYEWCGNVFDGNRILRGGRWDYAAAYCIIARRFSQNINGASEFDGFRVASNF
jgi:formylglycine-generating enzyme required for sulfatase activity